MKTVTWRRLQLAARRRDCPWITRPQALDPIFSWKNLRHDMSDRSSRQDFSFNTHGLIVLGLAPDFMQVMMLWT